MSLFGKAFTARTERVPPPESAASNLSAELIAAAPITALAAHPDCHLAALVTRDGIEAVRVSAGAGGRSGGGGSSICSAGSSACSEPVVAAWQPGSSVLVVADQNGALQQMQLTGTELKSLPKPGTPSAAVPAPGRQIKSLSFSTVQPPVLAAAVSDGSVRLYDIRAGLKRAATVLKRQGDVARECEFAPGSDVRLACIYDSGVVQLWDARTRTRELRINAHQQGLSLNFDPSNPSLLATGGRDRLVQVWNTVVDGDSAPSPETVLRLPHAVSCVKFVDSGRIAVAGRPIESFCMRQAYSVYEINRPYSPEYVVERHKDAVTDLFVAGKNLIWSVGLDKRFSQTDLRFESNARSLFPPTVVDMPPWDMAAVSFSAGNSINNGGTVLEVGLPYEDGDSLRNVAKELTFVRAPNQTHAEACRANARIMRGACRFKYAEMWSTLAVACEVLEREFLQTVEGEQRELGIKWFAGQIDEHFEARGSAIDFRREEQLFLSDEDVSRHSSEWNAFRPRSQQISVASGASITSGRPHVALETDPFATLKESFFTFACAQRCPWQFWPMLQRVLEVHLANGFYTGAMALVVLFRALPQLAKTFEVPLIIQGGLRTLEKYRCFVPMAMVRNILREESEATELYSTLVSSEPELDRLDTACARCGSLLSDNAAFYARNDAAVGYWYCFHCRLVLDGCCLCDGAITGLCRVLLECGHRLHMQCWTEWTSEGLPECPSGCGHTCAT